METVWSFQSGEYLIVLNITPDHGYQYDGDDENGRTQRLLDAGECVAFDSEVQVIDKHGVIIGRDSLGGSVYSVNDVSEFWEAHRDPDVMNRNSSARPGVPGVICHYFPEMVREAVREARDYLLSVQARHVRLAA